MDLLSLISKENRTTPSEMRRKLRDAQRKAAELEKNRKKCDAVSKDEMAWMPIDAGSAAVAAAQASERARTRLLAKRQRRALSVSSVSRLAPDHTSATSSCYPV